MQPFRGSLPWPGDHYSDAVTETAAEPRIPLGKAPTGWAPVTRYARVRTASGLVSTDEHRGARRLRRQPRAV
ncbi:MAG: hypothetical protein ACXVB5_23045, partial [Isosphaeraceae bacterium]